jgi:hypothetical protein
MSSVLRVSSGNQGIIDDETFGEQVKLRPTPTVSLTPSE